jgi:hypothetical protein
MPSWNVTEGQDVPTARQPWFMTTTLAMPAPAWHDNAPCAGHGNLFFSEDTKQQIEAKTICRECQFQQQCLDEAMVNGEPTGIWGGLTETERDALIKDPRRRKQVRRWRADVCREERRETSKGG